MRVFLISPKERIKEYIKVFIYFNNENHKIREYFNNPSHIQRKTTILVKKNSKYDNYYMKKVRRNKTPEQLQKEEILPSLKIYGIEELNGGKLRKKKIIENNGIIRERVRRIKIRMTPSHQSDIFDTIMCEFELLAGKENIVHGDLDYADYHMDYKKNGELTRISSFKIDLNDLLSDGGWIDSMGKKMRITLPDEVIMKRTENKKEWVYFPLFVCIFSKNKRGMIDINCIRDYNNIHEDLENYIRKYPEQADYL